MSNAANRIIFDQDKLDAIRAETERRMAEVRRELLDKVNARKDAHREGHLDEDRAAEIWRENDEKKVAEIKEHAQRQYEQEKRERIAKADQEKRDQQKRDDQRSEAIRAETREKMRAETERLVKDALKKHVEARTKEKPDEKLHDKQEQAEGQRQGQRAKPEPAPAQAPTQEQERIMAGASSGPTMTPRMLNDPVAMAAAMDHPGLTDDQKLIMARAGYGVGEGWHNREADRKDAMMQAERQKRDDLRAEYAKREPARVHAEREFKPDRFEDIFSKANDGETKTETEAKDGDQHDAGDDRGTQQDPESTQDTTSSRRVDQEDQAWYQRPDVQEDRQSLDKCDELTQDQIKEQGRSG